VVARQDEVQRLDKCFNEFQGASHMIEPNHQYFSSELNPL